jgi:hypothetical protein
MSIKTGLAHAIWNAMLAEITGTTSLHVEGKFDIGSVAINAKGEPVIDPKTNKPKRQAPSGTCKVTIQDGKVQGFVPVARFSTVEEAINVALPKALARTIFVLTSDDPKEAAKGGSTPEHMLGRANKIVQKHVTSDFKDALRVLITEAESKAGVTVSFVVTGQNLSSKGFRFAVNMTDQDKVKDLRVIKQTLTENGFQILTLKEWQELKDLDPTARAEKIEEKRLFEEWKASRKTTPSQAEPTKTVASA